MLYCKYTLYTQNWFNLCSLKPDPIYVEISEYVNLEISECCNVNLEISECCNVNLEISECCNVN